MSTDAITMVWRWNDCFTPQTTDADATGALTIVGFGTFTARFGWTLGSGNLGALTLSDGTTTVTQDLYKTTVGSGLATWAFEYYDPPWDTFLPVRAWRMTMTVYRATRPAAAGTCRCDLLLEVLNPADESTVYRSVTLSIDRAGMWGHRYSVTSSHTASYQSSTAQTMHAVQIDSLTAPWPVEAVVTGELIPKGANNANKTKSVLTSAGAETDIGIAPPFERGLVYNPLSAEQMIARRDVDADAGVDPWARINHAAAWAAAGGALVTPAEYLRGGIMARDGRHTMRLHQMADTYNGEQTFDRGKTWATMSTQRRAFNTWTTATDRPLTDICFDPLDGSGLAVGLEWSGTADRIFCLRHPAADEKTVIANCRSAGETDCLPHPHCYRRADGRWAVAWFVSDAPREYVSSDGGATWADDSPTEDWTAGAGAAYYTAFWQSISGQQVVAGYSFADEEVVILTRLSPAAPWTGPWLNAAQEVAAAPYVYQRPTGVWEAGWLVAGVWTLYTADDPAGTWTVVP